MKNLITELELILLNLDDRARFYNDFPSSKEEFLQHLIFLRSLVMEMNEEVSKAAEEQAEL